MKKILIFLLTAMLVLQSVCTAPAVFAASGTVPGSEELLDTLNMFDSSIYDEGIITRAELAAAVSGIMSSAGIDTHADAYILADVGETDDYAEDICKLISCGYMTAENIDGKYYFKPSETVMYVDAVKVMLCLLGYGDYIENFGGYPEGCIKVADDIDLISPSDDIYGALTADGFKKLVFKMMCTQTVHYIPSVPRGSVKESGKTFMENYLNIYYVDGILEATSLLDIHGRAPLKLNEIKINDVKYTSSLFDDNYKYLGSYIRAFVKDNLQPGVLDEVISMSILEKKNNSILISDPEKLSGGLSKLKVAGEGRRSTSYDIDPGANIFHNFKYLGHLETIGETSEEVKEILSRFGTHGSFEILMNDIDNDGSYDFLWIRDFTDIAVRSFKFDDCKIITDEYESYEMSTAYKNYAFVTLDENSGIFNLKNLNKNSVVSIIYDGNNTGDISRAVLYISKKKATGAITEVSDDTVTVNNEQYKISRAYAEKNKKDEKNYPKLKIGFESTFLINRFGEIVSIDGSGALSEGESYGFLTRVSKGDGIGDEVYAEMYTKSGDKTVYEFADKCTVNGVKIALPDLFKTLYNDYKKDFENSKLITVYSLVKYTVSGGKITKIEIAVDSETPERLYPEITIDSANSAQVDMVYKYTTFGKRVGVSDSTVTFNVPTLETYKDSLDDINAVLVNPTFNGDCSLGYEGVRNQSSAIALNISMQFFDLDSTNYAAATVRYYKYVGAGASGSSNLPLPSASSGSAFLITKIYKGYNDDGEDAFIFEAFDGYVKKTLYSVPLKSQYQDNPWKQFPLVCTYKFQREYPKFEEFYLDDLRPGDMVKFYLTAKNEVLNIYPMARGGKVEERAWIAGSYGNVMYGVNFGKVVAFENGRVLLREIDGVLRVHNIGANADIVKYSRSQKKGYLSNTGEIEVGMDVFLSSYYTGIRSMAYFED